MKTFTIIEHHEEGSDCNGDFFDIEVLDENGKVIAGYGDSYHDKGDSMAKGFVEGVRYATGERIDIEYGRIADREY